MGNRTPDLFNAIEALYQLSYDPLIEWAFLSSLFPDGGKTEKNMFFLESENSPFPRWKQNR